MTGLTIDEINAEVRSRRSGHTDVEALAAMVARIIRDGDEAGARALVLIGEEAQRVIRGAGIAETPLAQLHAQAHRAHALGRIDGALEALAVGAG